MSSRTCAARRAIAVLGTIVVIALAMACGDDGQAGPAGPSVVDAPPTTSTSPSAGALVDVAGGSIMGQPDGSGASVNNLDLSVREGVVRNAVRSDATIAKPVILELARVGTNELSLQWGVTSVGSEEARPAGAGLRPPLKRYVRFSRIPLSRRRLRVMRTDGGIKEWTLLRPVGFSQSASLLGR